MTTSVEAAQGRPLNLSSFAHITDVPLLEFDSAGLLFGGHLTDSEVGEVWWFATSRDDDDRARRESIAALVADAEAGTNGAGWLTAAFAELGRYVLGLDSPA